MSAIWNLYANNMTFMCLWYDVKNMVLQQTVWSVYTNNTAFSIANISCCVRVTLVRQHGICTSTIWCFCAFDMVSVIWFYNRQYEVWIPTIRSPATDDNSLCSQCDVSVVPFLPRPRQVCILIQQCCWSLIPQCMSLLWKNNSNYPISLLSPSLHKNLQPS